MSRFTITVVALLMTIGCRYSEQKALASGGSPIPVTSNDDENIDDGGEMDPTDTGYASGEGTPPVLETVEAAWAENTEGDWYIEASLTYTDEDDDVRSGGMVGVTLVVDGDTFTQEWFNIDGTSAIHDEEVNEVRFNPFPPDITDPGAVEVEARIQLKDAATNRSNEMAVNPS